MSGAVVQFLTDLRDTAGPTDFEHPRDAEIADNGGRQANVDLVTAVFTDFITIADGC